MNENEKLDFKEVESGTGCFKIVRSSQTKDEAYTIHDTFIKTFANSMADAFLQQTEQQQAKKETKVF